MGRRLPSHQEFECGKGRQGLSKVSDPGKRFIRVRDEASDLASDVGHLMPVHQGEHHLVEHGEHLSYGRQADATIILVPSVASRRQ